MKLKEIFASVYAISAFIFIVYLIVTNFKNVVLALLILAVSFPICLMLWFFLGYLDPATRAKRNIEDQEGRKRMKEYEAYKKNKENNS